MSNLSGSPVDLPIAPLPLTSKHRDELDRAILERLSDYEIPNQTHIEVTVELKDWICRSIVRDIIQETSYFLKRENLKNTLRVDIDMKNEGTLQEHPQLRDIIREVCQTRSNFTRIADLSECLCTRWYMIRLPHDDRADSYVGEIFQISESGNTPAPSAQGQRLLS
jgi:hypothetical protein